MAAGSPWPRAAEGLWCPPKGRSARIPATLPPRRRHRGPEEQEVYEAMAVLSHGERFEVLRDVPLPRSFKLAGAGVIAHCARQAGVLGRVLASIRSRQR